MNPRRLQHIKTLILLILSLATVAPSASFDSRNPKISPSLDLGNFEETLKVWVFFTDKGTLTESEQGAALDQYRAQMPERVKRRRRYRAHRPRPDVTDLPLESRYVDAVLQVGGRLRSKSRWLNGIGLEATPKEIDAIARLPFVRTIEPILQHTESLPLPPTPTPPTPAPPQEGKEGTERGDFPFPYLPSPRRGGAGGEVEGRSPPSAPPSAVVPLNYGNSRRQISQIQADFLHQTGFLGEGVVIGLLDTGFSLDHTALQGVDVMAQHDFVNDDDNVADELGQDDPDQDDHGSIVLGILAGNAPGSLMGIAYRASYLLAKTEKVSEDGRNFERQIEEDWWVEGLEWLEAMGADVVGSSLGYSAWYRFKDLDGKTSKVTIAANLAIKKGLPVIVAAGNLGGQPLGDLGLAGRIDVPADGFDVLAIGAVDSNGRVARFSAQGPTFDGRIKPDVLAMGEGVTSINSLTRDRFASNHRGTSVSAPLAAGVVTLLMQAFPLATPHDIAAALRTTASQSDKPDNTAGYGMIRARAAYEALLDQFGGTGFPQPITVDVSPTQLPITLGKLKREVLSQNYPNPFNAETWIPFTLAFPNRVTIRIYDQGGKLIQRLELGELPAGDYSAKGRAGYWDGRNLHGERVASGTYFYALELLGETYARKMILLE